MLHMHGFACWPESSLPSGKKTHDTLMTPSSPTIAFHSLSYTPGKEPTKNCCPGTQRPRKSMPSVLSLLVDELPGAQNEEAGGRAPRVEWWAPKHVYG